MYRNVQNHTRLHRNSKKNNIGSQLIEKSLKFVIIIEINFSSHPGRKLHITVTCFQYTYDVIITYNFPADNVHVLAYFRARV